MISPDLLAWIARLEALPRDASHYEVLGLRMQCATELVVDAFRAVAAWTHPDLHRADLSAAETERLLRAYSRVTAAYAALRDPELRRRYDRGRASRPPTTPPASTPGTRPNSTSPPPGAGGPSRPIAPRAVTYYRKAQAALANGDLGGAVLNLKMAVAADPASPVLRMALAQVEAELSGKK